MCGIAGFVQPRSAHRLSNWADSALARLAHRGPDDSGWLADHGDTWTEGTGPFPTEPSRVGLLHRRLSILDLSPLGHQPMLSADGRLAIVFNGEIYNYLELRAELGRAGHSFRTNSDTEVLLAALTEWGVAALPKLVGMFVFAVLDRNRNRLLLVRDFFGIKPLYYCQSADGFAFASEIKALRPLVSGRVRPDRVFAYLTDGLTDHGGETLLADVKQVPAAHWLEVDLETLQVGEPFRYWHIDLSRKLDLSFPAAVARARELFLQSVRFHLRSDVPLGAALSGGIDSSAIVAAMRAVEPSADVWTFTFVANEPGIDEEVFADLAAKSANASAHKVKLAAGDLIDDLDTLIATQDEPFGSTSIYAQYRVFRLAAENGVKVMLDGQGADEMLAGYHGYFAARLATLIGRGQWLKAYQLAGRAASRPGVGGRLGLLARGIRRLLPNGLETTGRRMLGRPRVPRWLSNDWVRANELSPVVDRSRRGGDRLRDRLLSTLTETSLPMLLRYEDRNSMAWSLESRVPFLTPALAEFFLGLPEVYLISRDGSTKHVFREAMRGLVPDAILDRRDKIGFATPEKRWLAELAPWVDGVLSPDRIRRVPALDATAVRAEWQAIHAGTRPFDWRVWRWVNMIRWAETWGAEFG